MSDTSSKAPAPGMSAKAWAIMFAVAIAIGAVIGAVAFLADDSESLTMRGEVVLASPARFGIPAGTCRTNDLKLRVNSKLIDLDAGYKQSDGSCLFSFRTQVQEVEGYNFELMGIDAPAGLPEKSVRRSMIDTNSPTGVVLEVTLRW